MAGRWRCRNVETANALHDWFQHPAIASDRPTGPENRIRCIYLLGRAVSYSQTGLRIRHMEEVIGPYCGRHPYTRAMAETSSEVRNVVDVDLYCWKLSCHITITRMNPGLTDIHGFYLHELHRVGFADANVWHRIRSLGKRRISRGRINFYIPNGCQM